MSSNKLFALIGLLFALGFACLTQAQVPMTGAGVGTPAPAAFQGAGDVVPGAGGYWALRCYTAAYAGAVATVKSPSDVLTTNISCNGVGSLSYAGTAIATTCAVSCTISTLNDQTGGGKDVTQATEASRPSYTDSCQNSRPCATFGGSASLVASGNSGTTFPQWASWVGKRTGNTSALNAILKHSGNGLNIGFNSASGSVYAFAGNVVTATATEASIHAVQNTIFNGGTSSSIYVDGSNTNTLNAGGTAPSGNIQIGGAAGGQPLTGVFYEVGLWFSDQSANNSAMNTNQHSSSSGWGF